MRESLEGMDGRREEDGSMARGFRREEGTEAAAVPACATAAAGDWAAAAAAPPSSGCTAFLRFIIAAAMPARSAIRQQPPPAPAPTITGSMLSVDSVSLVASAVGGSEGGIGRARIGAERGGDAGGFGT